MPKKTDAAEEEDPFDLIKRGIALESSSNLWGAADAFGRASCALHRLAAEQQGRTQTETTKDPEREKVAALYRNQSIEYLYRARHCFLKALSFENEEDRRRTHTAVQGDAQLQMDPLIAMISEEEARRRERIFGRIFASQDTEKSIGERPSEGGKRQKRRPRSGAKTGDKQNELESRLADLNSSLPKPPAPFVKGSRSHEEHDTKRRMDEIHKGLGRLGLSLPNSGLGGLDAGVDSLSEEDQVDLIISQAKDEARLEGHGEGAAGDEDSTIDENDSMFNGEIEEGEDVSDLLRKAGMGADMGDGEGLVGTAALLHHVSKAQALLLEAHVCIEDEDGRNDDKVKVDGEPRKEEAKPSGGSSKENVLAPSEAMNKGKSRVVEAQECLEQVLKEWP